MTLPLKSSLGFRSIFIEKNYFSTLGKIKKKKINHKRETHKYDNDILFYTYWNMYWKNATDNKKLVKIWSIENTVGNLKQFHFETGWWFLKRLDLHLLYNSKMKIYICTNIYILMFIVASFKACWEGWKISGREMVIRG